MEGLREGTPSGARTEALGHADGHKATRIIFCCRHSDVLDRWRWGSPAGIVACQRIAGETNVWVQ